MQISKEKEAQITQAIETEKEVMATLQKVRAYEQSILQLKKNIQKCNISLKELSGLQEQRTFTPLGKSFILKPKNAVAEELTDAIRQHERDIDEFEKLRVHLINKGKEKETQLQEQMKALKI